MKCFHHRDVEGVAICVGCGRGLCADCLPGSVRDAEPITCSPACAAAVDRNRKALGALLEKSAQSARASAFYCYLTAGLSAAAAVAAWFMLPSPFLIYFTGGCALVLVAAGFWHGRVAKRSDLPS